MYWYHIFTFSDELWGSSLLDCYTVWVLHLKLLLMCCNKYLSLPPPPEVKGYCKRLCMSIHVTKNIRIRVTQNFTDFLCLRVKIRSLDKHTVKCLKYVKLFSIKWYLLYAFGSHDDIVTLSEQPHKNAKINSAGQEDAISDCLVCAIVLQSIFLVIILTHWFRQQIVLTLYFSHYHLVLYIYSCS